MTKRNPIIAKVAPLGLFPALKSAPNITLELTNAARVSLERRLERGGGQTGCSHAWELNYWDHLHNAAQAYDTLQVMFRQSTFPKLMDTHPRGLFPIDGNLEAANGMLETLVQSRWMPKLTEIELLPATPRQWGEGSIHGVHVRGSAAIDLI